MKFGAIGKYGKDLSYSSWFYFLRLEREWKVVNSVKYSWQISLYRDIPRKLFTSSPLALCPQTQPHNFIDSQVSVIVIYHATLVYRALLGFHSLSHIYNLCSYCCQNNSLIRYLITTPFLHSHCLIKQLLSNVES